MIWSENQRKRKKMKTIPRLLLVAAFGLVSQSAMSQILLKVDISDPSAVTFAATGNFPGIDDSSVSNTAGVSLIDLFAVDSTNFADQLFSGDLFAAGTYSPYDTFTVGYSALTDRDITLWVYKFIDSNTQIFKTIEPAFTGTGLIDLTGETFKPIGSTGNIIVGDSESGSGAVIGQYQIIPEPSSLALLGLSGLLALRRRRA